MSWFRFNLLALLGSALLAASALGIGAPDDGERSSQGKLLLATTTSLRDSGLLDALLPNFEERTGIHVQVVAVGTGAALRMGREGNADVLLTHSEMGERQLVASGAALRRTPFMQNHFLIAGPEADPAGVAAAGGPVQAYQKIASAKAPYVSRGDDSGTHRKEMLLLELAGLERNGGWPGFASTGSGMGLTLQVAGERGAYVLSDLGTFLAYRERTQLVRLTEAAPPLRNVYAVLPIDVKRFPGRVNTDAATRFERFLVEKKTLKRIASFGVERFGEPLFMPLESDAP